MKKILSLILVMTILVSFAQAVETTDGHGDIAAPSDWALESIEKAEKINILERNKKYNYIMPINREDFCELIYNLICNHSKEELYEVSSSAPFVDTGNEKIVRLWWWGIINGKGTFTQEAVVSPDGVVKRYPELTIIAPHDLLTREEAATIIIRMLNKFFPIMAPEMWFEYEDSKEISDWAMTSVQTISNMGFMKGVDNNRFAPKDNLKVEEAITILTRIYDVSNPGESEIDSITFADKLYKNMPDDKNYMFSPLSVKMMLMMAANGADGETKEEILKTTGVKDLESYNENIRLMLDKYSKSDILKLNISNSIWINSDKTPQRFSKAYKDLLSESFDATSGIVNDKTVLKEVNGWVNKKTEGKIPEIINKDNKDFFAMLVNAVYFKGRWYSEFNKSATKKDKFTFKDGTKKNIDFMNRTAWMNYIEKDGVQIVELPYLNFEEVFDENGNYVETKRFKDVNISMYLMMGDDAFNPEEMLMNTELDSEFIALSVPKFNIEYDTQLNDMLRISGIEKAFSMDAEFTDMFDSGNMWLDSVIHKTYIKVDEEGTEAAAVTLGGMAGSARPPEPVEVKYNKPFTFVIKDNFSGEILFVGEYAFEE